MRKTIMMMTMIRWMVKVILMEALPGQVVTSMEVTMNLMGKMQAWTTTKKEILLKTMKTTLMI